MWILDRRRDLAFYIGSALAGELYGVPVHETQVGFKFLGPKMMETDALLGGEESGGYGIRGHVPERDGILAGLYMVYFYLRAGM